MAKGARGGRRGGGGGGIPVPVPAPAPAAAAVPAAAPSAPVSYSNFTDSDAAQLRKNANASYTPDVVDSIKLYTSAVQDAAGYSYSQNLNYKLDNGMKLNATEKFIDKNIQTGMHDLGKNVTMERYCHDDILKKCGITDYSKMSQQQLKNKLVGTEFDTTAYTSYAYDNSKNPFRPGISGGGGREVTMKTNFKANTKVVLGAKSQSEIVVNKGTRQRITDVYYDGTTATPRGRRPMPRVVIVTETV